MIKIKPTSVFFLFFLFSCISKNKNTYDQQSKISEFSVKAEALYKNKNYKKAKLYLDSLIKLDSISASYYFKRAYCKTMDKDFYPEDILSDYRKSLKYGYKNKQSIYLNMGFLFRITDRLDSAIIYLDKCLAEDPTNEKAILNKKEINEMLNKGI